MAYQVKELFYTLQGEGARTGRASVFCRFAGCNLWSGVEKDRANAKCYFCDTDFVGTEGEGGGKFQSSNSLADAIAITWPANTNGKPYIVFTGGEPLLQLDQALLVAVKSRGFEIAVETNGTIAAPSGIDWITVSPKPNSKLIQRSGNELKLVYPHEISPELVEQLQFEHFFISPMNVADGERSKENTSRAVEFCLQNPKWRLTLQTHKFTGIP